MLLRTTLLAAGMLGTAITASSAETVIIEDDPVYASPVYVEPTPVIVRDAPVIVRERLYRHVRPVRPYYARPRVIVEPGW